MNHSRLLGQAWQHASMVYPLTTGFHWGSLDFQWYIEGCKSRPSYAKNESGFHDVNRFIDLPPHARSNCLSIPDYVKQASNTRSSSQRTPLDVADLLDGHVSQSITILDGLEATGNAEYVMTVTDIRIVANLGRYYADKIRGATELAIYRDSKRAESRERAVQHLVDAAQHWYDYASMALNHHRNPLWTNRVGYVDWKKLYQCVLDDIRLAGGDPSQHGLPAAIAAEGESVVRWPR